MAGFHRRLVLQGLMRSFEVVLNEPLGHFFVEYFGVGMEVSQINEFFLQSPVKALVVGVVFGSLDSGIILLNLELLAGRLKTFFKLAAVVMSDSGNLTI